MQDHDVDARERPCMHSLCGRRVARLHSAARRKGHKLMLPVAVLHATSAFCAQYRQPFVRFLHASCRQGRDPHRCFHWHQRPSGGGRTTVILRETAWMHSFRNPSPQLSHIPPSDVVQPSSTIRKAREYHAFSSNGGWPRGPRTFGH